MGIYEVTRAVFLDRDGVLNRSIVRDGKPYPPTNLAEFELLPGVREACGLLKTAGFLLVVVTNQPDVGRGTQSQATVEEMHEHLRQMLPLDRIEVCYDSGHGVPSDFHKPAPGMLLRASEALGIDLAASFMVGDRWRDIDCGRNAGCTTLFIDYGYAEPLFQQPHYRVANLLAAAHLILSLASSQSHDDPR